MMLYVIAEARGKTIFNRALCRASDITEARNWAVRHVAHSDLDDDAFPLVVNELAWGSEFAVAQVSMLEIEVLDLRNIAQQYLGLNPDLQWIYDLLNKLLRMLQSARISYATIRIG